MSAPKKSETRMIRLGAATVERLDAMIQQILDAVEAGTMRDPGIASESINPLCNGLSRDQAVALLLEARDRHQARAKKSRQSRKKRKPPED